MRGNDISIDEFKENNIIKGFPGKSIGKNEEILKRPDWAGRKI